MSDDSPPPPIDIFPHVQAPVRLSRDEVRALTAFSLIDKLAEQLELPVASVLSVFEDIPERCAAWLDHPDGVRDIADQACRLLGREPCASIVETRH